MELDQTNKAFKYAVLAVPATILFIVPSYTDPINLPKLLALIPLTTAALVLFISLRKFNPAAKSLKSEKYVVGLYAILGIGMVLSGFLGTENYVRALFGTIGRNNGLIYYLCAITISVILILLHVQEIELKYLFKVISVTSVVFSGYSTIQFLDLDPVSWSNPYNRVIGTLGNPNFSSSVLASFSVFWLYMFLRSSERKTVSRAISLGLTSWMAFLSWSTDSIQGLLVLAMGACLVFYVYMRERFSFPLLPYFFFFGGGAALTVLFASFLGFGPLGNALEQYTLKLRAWYAFFGIKGMIDSPLTGAGVDNYISAFRLFRTEDFVGQYGSALSSNNAHSTPVQIGSSFGLIVFLVYCAIHLMILYQALRVINSHESSNYSSFLKGISILWTLVFAQSLLSIEIIGLGMLNWILGAIILTSSRNFHAAGEKSAKVKKQKKGKRDLPAWTGPLTIGALLVGTIPAIPVSMEDREFQNVALIQIVDEESRLAVQQNFSRLSSLTLYYPEKVDQILGNLTQAGMNEEIEETVTTLYQLDPEDVYAADLLATFFTNSTQPAAEILVREKMQKLDPWNTKLELALAKAYHENGDIRKLEISIARLKLLAQESVEYQQALELLDTPTSTS